MASNNRFLEWLDRARENITLRKEQSLTDKNRLAHKRQDTINTSRSSHNVVESFVAPPPFLLYIWAVFPLLFIATFQTNTIIAAIAATVINFVLIHMDTYQFVRFLMSGFVLIVMIALYQLNVI
ncbi:MAG: hypothetical protein V3U78_03325 [Thiotrichaceae bacterium]